MIGLLIFSILLLSHESGVSALAIGELRTNNIPTNYESLTQEQVRLVDPITAGSLSGMVIDSNGLPISGALIERVSHTWKAIFDEKKTDSKGKFSFGKMPKGRNFLKASKFGFNTLLVKIITTNKSKAPLKLSLQLSQ